MTFFFISLVSGSLLLLGLTLHRFFTTHPEAKKNIIYSVIALNYWRWITKRSRESVRDASPEKWLAWTQGRSFWKHPDLEKWLFVSFYGSFLYLAASGFFFAFFVPRGLFGYPLLIHVVAGGLFALSLSFIVLLRGKNYIIDPKLPELTYAILDPKKLGLTALRVQNAAFWLFALAGFCLAVSALAPMLPFLAYRGQQLMFELHRYSALLAVLTAVAFVDLESFNANHAGP